MFKPITASIVLLAFVAQVFSGQVIQLNYYLNPAAFAKNCENKARPAMHCNGKCQVMKKIQEEEKKEQQNQEGKSVNKNEVFSSRSFFCSVNIRAADINNIYFTRQSSIPVDRTFSIFHPPKL